MLDGEDGGGCDKSSGSREEIGVEGCDAMPAGALESSSASSPT